MNPPDVNVTVEGGVADVQVDHAALPDEVRDYDVDGIDDDHELLWTDQNGDRCVRYAVTHDVEIPSDQQEAVEQSNTP